MSEFTHDSSIGSWFFQAVVDSQKLERMSRNTRAAHWNKPRAVNYRESADITTTQTVDTEDTHQCLLAGVRVIRGQQTAQPISADALGDVNPLEWHGDPQVLFPTGIGLPPFSERPVILANAVGFEVEKTSGLEPTVLSGLFDVTQHDYSFLNWFGGLDWSLASGTSPEGVSYDVNSLLAGDLWMRACVARPIATVHTGQAGAFDLTHGIRFRVIFGRLDGSFDSPLQPDSLGGYSPRGYYIHWQAMGPVPAY